MATTTKSEPVSVAAVKAFATDVLGMCTTILDAERLTKEAQTKQADAEAARDHALAQQATAEGTRALEEKKLAAAREAITAAQGQLAEVKAAREAENRGRVKEREEHTLLSTELAKLRKIVGVPETVPA